MVLEGPDGAVTWYFNETLIEGEQEDTLVPIENGTYKASKTNACGEIMSNEIIIDYILSAQTNTTTISLYPNPTQEMLFLSGVSDGDDFQILDTSGRSFELTRIQSGRTAQFNVSASPRGTYIVRINKSNEVEYHRLIIQ